MSHTQHHRVGFMFGFSVGVSLCLLLDLIVWAAR